MTYRGTVKNGMVVLEAGIELPEGQPVEVVAIQENTSDASDLPGFGLWRDRADLADAGVESLRLRGGIENRQPKG